MRRASLGICLTFAACAPPPAPQAPASISVGQTFHLHSTVLGEDRVINVYLPPDYGKTGTRYPVLFALDGGLAEDFLHVAGNIDVATRNEVIIPHIVIGIENTERRRDLVPATDIDDEKKIAPHAGGTGPFRRFLRDELKPEIARRYRITGEAAVIGESFAGLFVLETLLVTPDLFDAYIAIDPSVWWNHAALANGAAAQHWTAQPKRLFIATADYEPTQEAVATFLAAVPPGLAVTYEPFPAEHHGTLFPIAESRAYRALFSIRKATARPTEASSVDARGWRRATP